MKGSRIYMIFLFAFLVIVFLSELITPHKFEWKPTYDKYDKEPFGSYVFDDVLSSSIPDYSVINQTFYQIFMEDSASSSRAFEAIQPPPSSSRAFLLTENNLNFTETDIEYLFKLLQLGNQVMFCTENFPFKLRDTLKFNIIHENVNSFVINNVLKNLTRDSIFFGTDTLNPVQIYEVFPQTHPVSIVLKTDSFHIKHFDDGAVAYSKKPLSIKCDSFEILVWNNNNKPLAIRAFLGKGELFLVSTSLMFTNFGMLDGQNASYAFRLLSYLKDKPLIRTEAYGVHGDKARTPLRYVLSVAPLRWATYFILTVLLLFMAFSAKRRQRIIPVVLSPPNKSLGFMQLISNLYYQKHDNIAMLKMKYMYFCTDVKNYIGVDMYDRVPNEQDYERMVEKTGMEKDFIQLLLQNVRLAIYRDEADDRQLQQYINGMNELLHTIKT